MAYLFNGRGRAYFAFVLAFLGIYVFLFIWEAISRSGFDTLARIPGFLGVALFVISAIVFWRGGHRARTKRVCAVMLKHLRCPHGGYDLRMLPTDVADGETVCPEFGCAWKLGDVQSYRVHCDG